MIYFLFFYVFYFTLLYLNIQKLMTTLKNKLCNEDDNTYSTTYTIMNNIKVVENHIFIKDYRDLNTRIHTNKLSFKITNTLYNKELSIYFKIYMDNIHYYTLNTNYILTTDYIKSINSINAINSIVDIFITRCVNIIITLQFNNCIYCNKKFSIKNSKDTLCTSCFTHKSN